MNFAEWTAEHQKILIATGELRLKVIRFYWADREVFFQTDMGTSENIATVTILVRKYTGASSFNEAQYLQLNGMGCEGIGLENLEAEALAKLAALKGQLQAWLKGEREEMPTAEEVGMMDRRPGDGPKPERQQGFFKLAPDPGYVTLAESQAQAEEMLRKQKEQAGETEHGSPGDDSQAQEPAETV